ncbi:dTDP-glucose 4,6-dehydratase [Paenibacillus sp. y28]|uniref:dTDP-glucose 4,6-dehydratase n=1 Tax=Paenibacillus sp. y28 TaxID=3129110 RepID=UPI003019485C
MKLLITGGAGFIGSNFILYMLQKYPHYKIVNLDSLTYAGNLNNLKKMENNQNYSFVYGDISNPEIVENLFQQKIDIIVNFAAESHVDRSIVTPQKFIETNIYGTNNLLFISKKYGIDKFIQVSTDEVYGSLNNVGFFTESSPLAPNSPYSASKAAADLLVRAYSETFGLPVNITRCSNNYGPHQHPEKLIPLVLTSALKDNIIPIYGDGLNIRDWLYVEDHCSAIDLILHQGKVGEIYNIGGGNERTNLQIVNTILKKLNKSTDLISYIDDRLGHDRRYAIDSSKIRKELGWKPVFTFDIGIRKTIDWYLNNKDWWEMEKK